MSAFPPQFVTRWNIYRTNTGVLLHLQVQPHEAQIQRQNLCAPAAPGNGSNLQCSLSTGRTTYKGACVGLLRQGPCPPLHWIVIHKKTGRLHYTTVCIAYWATTQMYNPYKAANYHTLLSKRQMFSSAIRKGVARTLYKNSNTAGSIATWRNINITTLHHRGSSVPVPSVRGPPCVGGRSVHETECCRVREALPRHAAAHNQRVRRGWVRVPCW